MKHAAFVTLGCAILGLAGCATGNKFIDPRTDLDRRIYYIERDSSGDSHAISGDAGRPNDRTVTRVPMPAAVDVNSTIQVAIDREQIANDKASGPLGQELQDLLERKRNVLAALKALDEVVRARTATLRAYEQKNFDAFFKAREESNKLESDFRNKLLNIWPPKDTAGNAALRKAYDRPRFQRLQEFLGSEVAAIEATHRELERQLQAREKSLALEAFLTSPGKQPAAIHLDGYDAIKAESLVRRDPLGLDLSPEERARLAEQAKATRELAQMLERVRRGEEELDQALRKAANEIAPQLTQFVSAAAQLYKELGPDALPGRLAKTEDLFRAFLEAAEERNQKLVESKRAALQKLKDQLVRRLPGEVQEFQKALQALIATGKDLRSKWQQATPDALTPEALVALINEAVGVASRFDAMRKQLPGVAGGVRAEIESFVPSLAKELQEESASLLVTEQALALRADLDDYVADMRRAEALVGEVALALGRLRHPVAELPPSTTSSFNVPLDDVKDTFINLEQTPRVVGDLITVRASVKTGGQVVDRSIATFRVERFGHYAELSPAVVLVKPDELAGANDGYRFAPTLSWMHHWAPRPGNSSRQAALFRTLDPAIGIHSAFTNFASPTSSDSVQIGIGATLSLWKDRLQFGLGYNLMARSDDEGRRYFFIGSDLIGLLQALGIGRQ